MRDRIQKARVRVHLSLYDDETTEVCQWQLPEAHFLETWGDARAFDGTWKRLHEKWFPGTPMPRSSFPNPKCRALNVTSA